MKSDYKPEHIFGALLELRDYERLESRVSMDIQEYIWSYIVKTLKRGLELEFIVPGWDIPLRKGVLRDGLMALLGLQDFVFLDVEFLDAFGDLESNNLVDLRSQAKERAMSLAKEQVKRGVTFFMDLEIMKENEFAVLVPGAIEARTREIQRLGDKPHLYEIYSTYYGFMLLTEGAYRFKTAGVPERVSEELLEVLGEMGGVKGVKSKQLKFSNLAFRKCSSDLMVVLWNMLRLALAGKKLKLKALKKLGELGDSRPLDLIHSMLDTPHGLSLSEKQDYMVCLGEIGHPSSFSRAREYAGVSHHTHIDSFILGQIRHPEVNQALENMPKLPQLYMRNKRSHIPIIQALGNTRSPQWLPHYEEWAKKTRYKEVREAIEKARRNIRPEGTY